MKWMQRFLGEIEGLEFQICSKVFTGKGKGS